MGIETSADHSGAECSFTSAIIAVEELAKVDPSVAVMVDVHNTLVNTVLRLYGSEEIKQKWLPDLATKKVGLASARDLHLADGRLALSAFRSQTLVQTRLVCRRQLRRTAITISSTEANRERIRALLRKS
jgi:hypothetical protein